MSRTELVKNVLAEVLRQTGTSERASKLDVQAKGEGKIQSFFLMDYWNAKITVLVTNTLNAEGVALESWTVDGTYSGQVHVRLELFDVQALLSIGLEFEASRTVGSWNDQKVLRKYLVEHKSATRKAEALENGIDVNIVEITGEHPKTSVKTDEGFSWWGDGTEKLGEHRITRDFYDLIKKCHEENEARKEG